MNPFSATVDPQEPVTCGLDFSGREDAGTVQGCRIHAQITASERTFPMLERQESGGVPTCHGTMLGEGCGHPVSDHVEPTPNTECCCCTRLQNAMSHVDGCLDCAIKHAKRQCRIRGISQTPTTVQVEPFIPDGLKRAFWNRYVGKYFDATSTKGETQS